MFEVELGKVERVLCLGAHPDDIEIGCGGTILELLRRRAAVDMHWVVLSGAGSRTAEARESATEFLKGARATSVMVEGFRDSLFPYEGEQIKQFLRTVRAEISPDIIFSHRREDRHQDHRAVAELTWNVFRDHLIVEYEIPKYEGDLGTPNIYVSLSDELHRRKVEAIVRIFQSQAEKHWFSADTFSAVARLRGIECNSPSGYAEGLYCRKLLLRPS